MPLSWGPNSHRSNARSLGACPECASTLIEETPFRTDTEVICRCLHCLAVFRMHVLALLTATTESIH